jgi:hypothetical protein
MTRPPHSRLPAGVLVAALGVGGWFGASAAVTRPALGLGYEYDLGGQREEFLLPDPILDPSIASDHPLYVRVRAPWSLLERSRGLFDWSEVDRIVDPYRAARYEVILCLFGVNPAVDPAAPVPGAARPEVLKAWLEFTRAAADHFKGRVRYYEIWDEPNRQPEWSVEHVADYAYLLKLTSVTVRSADPSAEIVQGGLALGEQNLAVDLAWQAALYDEGIATYVDVLSVHPGAGAAIDVAVARAYDLVLAQDPSAQLWANRVPLTGQDDRERASDLLRRFVAAQGEGASLVTFDLEADVEGGPEFPGVLLDLHKLFLPIYSRATGSRVRFAPYDEPTAAPLQGVRAYEFFDAESFQGLIAFFAPEPPPEGRAQLVLGTAAVRGVSIYDIVGGAAGPIRTARSDFGANVTRVPVFLYPRPQVLQYARVPVRGFEAEKERVEVQGSGLVSAEEIIAGHQQFMSDQDHRLRHYRSQAVLTYHGKLAGSDTLDISFDNDFFWDSETGAEWEQNALYYNGVRWKGNKLPELPIPQPEKVFTLPLDIHLGKDYTYEYRGREKVGDYDCYVLEFKPIATERSLYEGRVWIETRTYAAVKMATVQTNLKSPIISNEERDMFAPRVGPDGSTFWLLSHVEGQQILTVAGRNLVLLREIDFRGFQINDPGFEGARQQAYASSHTMLRDTDRGLKYLERTPEGGRRVQEGETHRALLGLAGLYRQTGLDYPVLPLAGVEYFNFKLAGRDAQINALLGGLVNVVTLTDPKVAGTRIDASGELLSFLPRITDRLYVEGDERKRSDVRSRAQSFSGSLGAPLGNFLRLKGLVELEYDDFAAGADTDPAFVVPVDTSVRSGGIEWEFNRSAWTVTASGRRSVRGTWNPWGDTSPPSPETAAAFPSSPCDSPGSCLVDFESSQRRFDTYSVELSKQVFLPLFQKLRFEATGLAGSRLDRFSEYQFSFFGDRLHGFAGSGVRFDRGAIVRAQYSFNVADVIRVDAMLDRAYVRDGLVSDHYQTFTGFGVSGNLMGPWQTVLQFDVGLAIGSDIPKLRGDTEFLVGLLRYF